MTRHEQLLENYEDAYFALLMEEVAQQEGERMEKLNHELQADPNAAVPAELDRRCLKTIDRCFAKQRYQSAWRTTGRILNRVAVAAAVMMLMFTTAFAASPTFRTSTLNLIIQTFDDHTSLSFAEPADTLQYTIVAGWLPNGFTLEASERNSTVVWNTYKSSDNREMHMALYDEDGSSLGTDTENANVQNMDIQGYHAMVIEKENSIQIVWGDMTRNIFVEILGINMSEDDMLQIAENLTIK